MPNQNDSTSPADDSRQYSESKLKVLPEANKQSHVSHESQQNASDQQAIAKEMRREFRWVEWVSVGVNLALAIIGVCALRIYSGQLKMMSRQLVEMQQARQQTRTDNAAAITAQQAIAESALTASQGNFKKSFAETQESFRRDQRAWVGFVEGSTAPYTEGDKRVYLKFGEKPRFSVTFSNSGKTPALKVASIIAVWGYRRTEKFVPHYGESQTVSTVQTLFPGQRSSISTTPSLPEVGGSQMNLLLSDEYVYRIFGKITYDDVFNRHHKTTFCAYVSQTFTELLNCPTYNDAD